MVKLTQEIYPQLLWKKYVGEIRKVYWKPSRTVHIVSMNTEKSQYNIKKFISPKANIQASRAAKTFTLNT